MAEKYMMQAGRFIFWRVFCVLVVRSVLRACQSMILQVCQIAKYCDFMDEI